MAGHFCVVIFLFCAVHLIAVYNVYLIATICCSSLGGENFSTIMDLELANFSHALIILINQINLMMIVVYAVAICWCMRVEVPYFDCTVS